MINSDSKHFANEMVKKQLISRGINDQKVLYAMSMIPREIFVANKDLSKIYGDFPLPIGKGQTISQPYMVALMSEYLSLRESDRVLEIGTGSGYQTAVLAHIVKEVYTIERIAALANKAKSNLEFLNYKNIFYRTGDGTLGWPEKSPFDKILVTAAAPRVLETMKQQLSDNGILVVPVGDYRTYQELMIILRVGSRFQQKKTIGCRFVPLIGVDGF